MSYRDTAQKHVHQVNNIHQTPFILNTKHRIHPIFILLLSQWINGSLLSQESDSVFVYSSVKVLPSVSTNLVKYKCIGIALRLYTTVAIFSTILHDSSPSCKCRVLKLAVKACCPAIIGGSAWPSKVDGILYRCTITPCHSWSCPICALSLLDPIELLAAAGSVATHSTDALI